MKSEKFTFFTSALKSYCSPFWLMFAVFSIWSLDTNAQCPLACNNLVQVSMDEDCIVEITPDMMLEGQGVTPGCNYVVQVLGTDGKPLSTSPNVTSANVGQTLQVKIWLGVNSCWGQIKIEDKLAPVFTCPDPITIACWDKQTFGNPTVTDNCSSVTVSTLSDITTELPCTDMNRARREIRYQAKDASGNVSDICTRVIYYSKITLADIHFPKNYDGVQGNRPSLKCDKTWPWGPFVLNRNGSAAPINNWDTNNDGYPNPSETGGPFVRANGNITGYINGYKVGTPTPAGASLPGCTAGNLVGNDIATASYRTTCDNNTGMMPFRIDTLYSSFDGNDALCKINVTFSDTRVDICPQSFKVLRQWTVLDWCTGGIKPGIQIIKVEDDKAPIVTCPADMTSSIAPVLVAAILQADPYTCTASWNVRPPIAISDCSNTTTYSIKLKLADPTTGDDPGDTVPFVLQDGNTRVTGSYPNFVLTGLPLGRTWVQYTVTDECGNSSNCFTEVDVFDTTPPVAVCDEHTVVTLSNNGWAHVFAESFDDGSHDNCSEVSFLVRRMTPGCGASTSTYAEYVQFCCEDVGKDITVELQVTDEFGNKNTCMVIANVQDKVPPVITCPSNVTINCGADTSATALGRPVYSQTALNTPYFTDNCPNPRMTYRTTGSIDNCGQGVLTRVFTVTDNGGRTASCTQVITVRNNTPYNGPSAWPTSPLEIEGCMNIDTDPSKTGKPTLGNNACSQVAYTFEDQVFPFVDGVCFKILRKWTVIDWCKFGPNVNPTGDVYPTVPTEGVNMWTRTQIIKISENEKPEIQTLSKAPTDAFGENCNGFVELTNSATDCTPSNQLVWSYIIDPNNDNVGPFITGNSNDASGTYPVGTHKITWTVEDMCGNQASTMYTFVVKDAKKPTPYCLSDVTTVIMPSSGNVTIWASDFNLGSFDNCPGTLRYAFSTNPSNTSMTFTCDDLGENTVTMYVFDVAGNFDFCTVTVDIQANGTACSGSRLAGSIGTEKQAELEGVTVIAQNMSNNESSSTNTSVSGRYEFSNVPEDVSYKITPNKNDDPLNGVSTMDLVMIQRHILDINKLNSPYKYLAADINHDNKITAADLSELRKLILGIYAELPNNTSWRFFDKKNVLSTANVWTAQEYIYVDKMQGQMTNNDFVAVKVGDINDDAEINLNSSTVDTRSAKAVSFETQEQEFRAGQLVRIPVTSSNFDQIVGTQFTLDFDQHSLTFVGVESGKLQLSPDNYNDQEAENGKIALSWNDVKGVSASNEEVLFTLIFEATTNNTISNSLTLSSNLTTQEAYTSNLDILNINLRITSPNSQIDGLEVFQNNPNPFAEFTTIGFKIPASGNVTLNIFDLNGKSIYTQSNTYDKGIHEITIDSHMLEYSGVYFYEIEFNGTRSIKKMIRLDE